MYSNKLPSACRRIGIPGQLEDLEMEETNLKSPSIQSVLKSKLPDDSYVSLKLLKYSLKSNFNPSMVSKKTSKMEKKIVSDSKNSHPATESQLLSPGCKDQPLSLPKEPSNRIGSEVGKQVSNFINFDDNIAKKIEFSSEAEMMMRNNVCLRMEKGSYNI